MQSQEEVERICYQAELEAAEEGCNEHYANDQDDDEGEDEDE